MQSVQRHFGKYMKRSADESQISVLLKDFEDADLLLAKVGVIFQHFLITMSIRCGILGLIGGFHRS